MSAYVEFKKDLAQGCLAVLAVTCVFYFSPYGRDSTDGSARSGMALHTDALTGCQYLSVSGGGITPRLGVDGKQLCTTEE